jgi:hypothetical protein
LPTGLRALDLTGCVGISGGLDLAHLTALETLSLDQWRAAQNAEGDLLRRLPDSLRVLTLRLSDAVSDRDLDAVPLGLKACRVSCVVCLVSRVACRVSRVACIVSCRVSCVVCPDSVLWRPQVLDVWGCSRLSVARVLDLEADLHSIRLPDGKWHLRRRTPASTLQ